MASLVLSGQAKENRISNEISKKVLRKTNEVEYQPNQPAKSIRTGRTGINGFIVPAIKPSGFDNLKFFRSSNLALPAIINQ